MSGRTGRIIAGAVVPGFALLAFVALVIAWRLFDLPDSVELVDAVQAWFREYGLWIVAPAALLEGLVVVGFYVPGSAVIVIAVAATRDDPVASLAICLVAAAAFWLDAQLAYLVGRRGLRPLIERSGSGLALQRSDAFYLKFGAWAVTLSCVHPNVGALMAVSSGSQAMPYETFWRYSLLGYVASSLGWGGAVFAFGPILQEAVSSPLAILAVLMIWTLTAIVLGISRERRRGL